MGQLITPLGKYEGNALIIGCYLFMGPLYVTPRMAMVSYEMGVHNFLRESSWALPGYCALYFIAVVLVAFFPGRLLDSVGKVLAPSKLQRC